MSLRWTSIETELLQVQTLSTEKSNEKSVQVLVDPSVDRNGFRFCRRPSVQHNNITLRLLYQCEGQAYEDFGHQLLALAKNYSILANVSSQWAHRRFPLPANKTVLVLGNSHLRQISKTIMCQYSDRIESIHPSSTADVFLVTFTNGATWMSITNTVLVYSEDWIRLLEQEYLQPLVNDSLSTMDAIVFGKFTRFLEAQHTNFEFTMKMDQQRYVEAHGNTTKTTIDFATIPPPHLVDLATAVSTPIISVPMFSLSDQHRAQQERDEYEALQYQSNSTHVHFLETRQFIDTLGLECGSDDKLTIGTCHEPSTYSETVTNLAPRHPADMHRCAGSCGGLADFVAWSLIEDLNALWIQ